MLEVLANDLEEVVCTARGSNASPTAELGGDDTSAAQRLAYVVQNGVSVTSGSNDASASIEPEADGSP